jgi:multimeric flavodoxin WrbA
MLPSTSHASLAMASTNKRTRKSPRKPRVVKGTPDVTLPRAEFERRFRERFFDPAFARRDTSVEALGELAWQAYEEYRKSPRTAKAGRGFADPDFELPVEWLAARREIRRAQARHDRKSSPSRVLVVNGSARSDMTCPGEMSKTYRLAQLAIRTLRAQKGFEVDFLDLSRLCSEYGRTILPCKACVSTAQPLCHWPCSCYPNHAMGQVNDWMNELYPRFVAAHGLMFLAPVNWYQAPSVLKLLIDRLVCADGGNPDPTTTGGKDPVAAKQLELEGWPYPRHLAGRAFAVVVHGDAAGVEQLTANLCSWLTDMELVPAAPSPGLGRYLGYFGTYAESHDDLDRDEALQTEVKSLAQALGKRVRQIRAGKYTRPDEGLDWPRQK